MQTTAGLTRVSIEEQMKSAYLEYAMSVIVGRALPDARDGMKPVHRRILFAMHDLGNTHDKPYKKSARIVGDVIGKYHPHGDVAVYDTLVRMAQDFTLRYPLVQGQGNFGSVDGDSPAAMRYTEVRLSRIAATVLADIDKETVHFTANYDNALEEPTLLPSRLPNLLLNGSSGIAVGMATSIPPHNLREVVGALKLILQNPNCSLLELIACVPGPDFPTGGFIYGRNGIAQAYETGKGIIQIRAKTEVETIREGRYRLIATEIPFQVNKSKLIETVADLVRDKKVEGISDIRDESNRSGMRVVFELKKDQDPQIVLNQLFKLTSLQTSFSINMLALDKQQPRLMSLRDLLQAFLHHRQEVVLRRTSYELRKALERAHILEGLKKAVENLDPVLALIRKGETPAMAEAALREFLELTPIQSKAILEMRLQRLTGLERQKIISDHEALLRQITDFRAILADDKLVQKIILEELDGLVADFGDERRTQILDEEGEIETEALIPDEQAVVSVTYTGYIKRLPVSTYRQQKRGGRGKIGSDLKAEDFIQSIFVSSTKETLFCFSDQGRLYWLRTHKVPEMSRIQKGKPIVNLLNLSSHERIQAVLPVRDVGSEQNAILVSKRGQLLKTLLSDIARPNRKGIWVMKLREGDSVVDVQITNGKKNVLLVTRGGYALLFDETDARVQGRNSLGTRGIRLQKGDEVVGMQILDPSQLNNHILVVTERGLGKQTPISEYRCNSRGNLGVLTLKVTEKSGPVVAVRQVEPADALLLAASDGNVLRVAVSDISEYGRYAQGVKLIDLQEGQTVVAVAKIMEKDGPTDEGEGTSGGPPGENNGGSQNGATGLSH